MTPRPPSDPLAAGRPDASGPRRRAVLAWAVAGAASSLVAACSDAAAPATATAPTHPASRVTTPTAAPTSPTRAPASGAASSAGAPQGPAVTGSSVAPGERPQRVLVPRIGVDSTLVGLGIAADGSIEVPRDFGQAGWLDVGPAPGQRGPAVIAGHVDSRTGPAVFYRLRELRVGDAVTVQRADGRQVRFTVDDVQQYPKDRFPTDAVYGPSPGPVLRLITCGGSFDRASGHYRDNVVVYAS